MEENIRERLVTKCQQLSEGWSVRALNVLAWLTKDVEDRLLPLICGTADVRRIPQCGPQTSILLEDLLQKLRPFYEQLVQNQADEASGSVGEILYTRTEKPCFRFLDVSASMELRVQTMYEKMVDNIGYSRARNLIRRYWKKYRDTEPYMSDASDVWKWYGAGKETVAQIQAFLEDFRAAYQSLMDREEAMSADATSADADMLLPDLDYPFLSAEEQQFVVSFWAAEGRYPVFYIALRYLRRASDRPTQTFSRVHGIMGKYETLQDLAAEYGLTFERTRQMSKLKIDEDLPVWNRQRWAAWDFYHQHVLTEAIVHWESQQTLEHIEDMDFYSALAILATLRGMEVVALRADGYKANARRGKGEVWERPQVLFAYDKRLDIFRVRECLRAVGQKAMLQRIEDQSFDLRTAYEELFNPDADDALRQQVLAMLKVVLPLFPGVEVRGDTVVFCQNHTNYIEEIYQILSRRGSAMTVEDIYAEFRQRFPDDHHTDSSFLRSYMWQDARFEAVGRKSTYQLREWKQFAGSLQELAIHLVEDEAEPLPAAELIDRMTAHRSSTTAKSCESIIYQAVVAGGLQYYFTADNNAYAAYVGLPEKDYPPRFWVSPLTVEGAVASMHRFLSERQHRPYLSSDDEIESRLNYTLRKYALGEHVTEEERTRFQQGMADIPPFQYPHNEREAIFMERCRATHAFWEQHHRLPDREDDAKLSQWHRETKARQHQLDDFRKYHFERIGQKAATPHQQLSFDFGDDET